MKKLLSVLLCAFLLASLPVVTSSCAHNQTQQQITYNTLYTVAHSVDAAWGVYAQLMLDKKVSSDTLKTIVPLYRSYQTTYMLALNAAQMNPNAIAPADVTKMANDLIGALTNLKRLP